MSMSPSATSPAASAAAGSYCCEVGRSQWLGKKLIDFVK
jgi:hypothetical protein